MKKITLIVIMATLFLVPSFAQNVSIISPESSIIVYAGEQNIISIPITNTGEKKDTIYISVWPTEWVNLKTYWVTLNPGETKEVSLFAEPPKDAEEGISAFTVTLNSVDDGLISSSSLFLNVKRRNDIFISRVKMNKQTFLPDEVVTIEPVITNLDKYNDFDVTVSTDILKDGTLVWKIEDPLFLEAETSDSVSQTFMIDNTYESGRYTINVVVRDSLNKVLDQKQTYFEISEINKINKRTSTEWGLFFYRKTFFVENVGNTKNSTFALSDSIPRYMVYFFYPQTEPFNNEVKDKRMVYYWAIENLNPGETEEIVYTLNFFSLFVAAVVAGVIVFIIIKYLSRPMMVKTSTGFLHGNKDVSISLYIKNKGSKVIRNVIVKDFVPSVVKIINKFDTLKPSIKKKPDGIEMTWKIAKIKPKEEIILNYRIRSAIEVIGDLRLPSAKMLHESGGKKKIAVSKTVDIKGKIK
jgi:hypothetical protein